MTSKFQASSYNAANTSAINPKSIQNSETRFRSNLTFDERVERIVTSTLARSSAITSPMKMQGGVYPSNDKKDVRRNSNPKIRNNEIKQAGNAKKTLRSQNCKSQKRNALFPQPLINSNQTNIEPKNMNKIVETISKKISKLNVKKHVISLIAMHDKQMFARKNDEIKKK